MKEKIEKNKRLDSIRQFIKDWEKRGYRETSDTHIFWNDLLTRVFGIKDAVNLIEFQKSVKPPDNPTITNFIDAYIPSTKVLIEQKSRGKDLDTLYRQSDGSKRTPFGQAKHYFDELPLKDKPNWIITCNFEEFHIYDMNLADFYTPEIVKLEDLEKDYIRLMFLVDKEDEHIKKEKELSIEAAEVISKIYNALLEEYDNTQDEKILNSLNVLVTRLVFCFFAEDSGLFPEPLQFFKYMKRFREDPYLFEIALTGLFEILNTSEEKRTNRSSTDLMEFPYVNGGLFKDEDEKVPMPIFNKKIIDLILDEASEGFDWSDISPTIFGAAFESTINPESRHKGGMHYTSIENIHKVIDPLFLDNLKEELLEIQGMSNSRGKRNRELHKFIKKISELRFLDPACGSGNFLTETYISLRRLENEALQSFYKNYKFSKHQVYFEVVPIKVSISQFYGIEINDFAVNVAKTALYIAEYQMLKETEKILNLPIFDVLPLKDNQNIVEGNALQLNWNKVLNSNKCSYVMGNPPYSGGMVMSPSQKQDIKEILKGFKNVGEMDYVAAWFKKAAVYMNGTEIKTAFVSTNSIVQGQQAVTLWKPLIEKYKVNILFAYQSFVWINQSRGMAKVHCVIIGFSDNHENEQKLLFTNEGKSEVENINIYLKNTPNIYVESRSKPISPVPEMFFGSMPRDGKNFTLNESQKNYIIKKNPLSKKWIHLYLGAKEFINNKKRWCLWLVDAEPGEIRKSKEVVDRINKVRKFRENSKAKETRKLAKTPTLFAQIAQPNVDYLAVPSVSSEKREYVPIGFLSKDVIASNAMQIIPGADIYHFGVLTSNVHNAWMRAVAGRLKSDYRYAKDIVYNTFPWPKPTKQQKQKIQKTAQVILDIRDKYKNSSFADLYDKLSMPKDLLQAHRENDIAVMEAYGWDWKNMNEEDYVQKLMELYQMLESE